MQDSAGCGLLSPGCLEPDLSSQCPAVSVSRQLTGVPYDGLNRRDGDYGTPGSIKYDSGLTAAAPPGANVVSPSEELIDLSVHGLTTVGQDGRQDRRRMLHHHGTRARNNKMHQQVVSSVDLQQTITRQHLSSNMVGLFTTVKMAEYTWLILFFVCKPFT